MFVGPITQFAGNNDKLRSAPGKAGHLWYTIGDQQNAPSGEFKRSVDGGKRWTTIKGVLEVKDFGFGAIKPGSTYPTIWIAGWVNFNWGIYCSADEGRTWNMVTKHPLNSLDQVVDIDGDKNSYGKAYL